MAITRTPLAALAASTTLAASVGVATAAAPAAADDPPLIEHCVTFALPVEEIEAGAVNEFECWWEEEYTPVSMRATLLMVHWDYFNGAGSAYDVYGSSCTGHAINLSGTSWDNRISSTTQIACGNAKHYTGVFSGSNQLTQGTFGVIRNMNGTLNNAVTTVEYAP